MNVTDITPGRRSPAARLRKQTGRITSGSGPVRRARSLADAALPTAGPTTRMRRRTRAIRSAAERSRLRQADWPALGSFALSLTNPPRRRRPDPRLVVGGALGAGAAAAVVARRRSESSERTDRDNGGPTGPDRPDATSQATGAGQGTKGNLQFEPHQ